MFDEVQCPSCGEFVVVPQIAPEDFGGEIETDCEVC